MDEERYLIKNTTKEQREEMAKNAFVLASAGGTAPSKEVTKLIKEYVDGKKELKEIEKEIIEMYTKK